MRNNQLFRHYIWLIDLLYSTGGLTRSEIQARWLRASINDEQQPLDIRTFHRYREAIEEIWGIQIDCDPKTYRYSLHNMGDLGTGNAAQTWMSDSFAIQNMITHTRNLRERVIFEHIPAGTRFLSIIVSAMSEQKKLRMSYQRFNGEPHSFLLSPYCIKAFKQRWYLVGKPDEHPEETDPRVYALDRIRELSISEADYAMPDTFYADAFFRHYYGIDRREAPQPILLRATADAANYLRSLPLHRSQQETCLRDGSSEFRFYIAPTYDFIQELRKHGPNIEVVEPLELRQKMADDARRFLSQHE